MASPTITNPKSRWYFHRYFRLTVLLGVLVVEIAFLYMIKTTGWLNTLDFGTQVGVYALVLSPLLIALPLLIRKQVGLLNVMIVVSLLAIFLGYSFRPVYFARQQKQAALQLANAGIEFQTEAYLLNQDGSELRFDKIVGDRSSIPEWVDQVLGKDYQNLPYSDEIMTISIATVEQLKALDQIKLNQLKFVNLSNNLSDNALRQYHENIINLKPQFINFDVGPRNLRRDVSWLEDASCITHLSMNNCKDAPDLIAELAIPNLKYLGLVNRTNTENVNWNKFFDSSAVKNVESLYLFGYATVNDLESEHFKQMQNLKTLFLTSSITDYRFLHELKKLRTLVVHCPAISDDGLRNMKLPESIHSAKIYVPAHLSEESTAEFSRNNPRARDLITSFQIKKYVEAAAKAE